MTGPGQTASTIDICLVVPPFESLHHPNLGTAILKSACLARGLSTRIVYGGLLLAARIGHTRYDAVYDSPMRLKVGERLFRAAAYPAGQALPDGEPLRPDLQALSEAVEPAIAPTLEELVERILALQPKIVGVTSSFQQNLAASAVARRVKQAAPEIVTVMGGPNVAGPLAAGLAKAFPWIDYFFSGEADVDFPDFCEAYLRHGTLPASRIVVNEPIRDMRTVFPPDFDDYFAQLRPMQADAVLPAWLPRHLLAETSRGCWWGAKHHCTFCGLNAEGMNFREKPAEQVLDELAALERWNVPQVMMTDNIMPRRYLDDLLPRLARKPHRLGLFYEIKANLTEAQVDLLVEGGVVALQPGIESLSSNVLRLMRKGVSAHQNIALLRHCNGVGLQVFWNILYGFPGERAQDYADMIAVFPKLHHLFPPASLARIVIDRYSPYFANPEAMGVAPITPQPAYRSLYPAEIATEEIAYHFTGDYRTELLDTPALIEQLRSAMATWRQSWSNGNPPLLQLFERDGQALVLDTRAIARQPLTKLSEAQRGALFELRSARSGAGMEPELAAAAHWLIDRGFVIDHEDTLTSVVVHPRPAVAAQRACAAQSFE